VDGLVAVLLLSRFPNGGLQRFGNVDVSYGYPNPDEALLGRIKAAVADLRQ
jgi:hypothetical protein